MDIHYVYVLRSSLDGKVFYVGKSVDGFRGDTNRKKTSREYAHAWRASHGSGLPVHCKIRKIWSLGGHFKMERVFESENEGMAYNEESKVISVYGIENLMNLSHGGKGPSGWHHSPETLAKFSAQRKGHKFSDESKRKIAEKKKAWWAMKSREEKVAFTKKGLTACLRPENKRSMESYSKATKSIWDKKTFEERRAIICKGKVRNPKTGRMMAKLTQEG